ncbi:hypothetical protein [Streptosporangium sp. NPDC002524]|uniref:hypothetical protein n=1 Tax=Streptosporangium sp. NPDC002524 TaxID=3154537 RepID=UPI003317F1E9
MHYSRSHDYPNRLRLDGTVGSRDLATSPEHRATVFLDTLEDGSLSRVSRRTRVTTRRVSFRTETDLYQG